MLEVYPTTRKGYVYTWCQGFLFLFKLVVQLEPSSDGKEHFVHHLSKGPALLLFLPMKLHMCRVTKNILETVSCSCNIPYKVEETSVNVFFNTL